MSTSAPPEVVYDARLVTFERTPLEPAATSWFITHPLGGPAAGTFTEVVFDGETAEAPLPFTESVLETVVRDVAAALYGARYAFIYPPHQRDRAMLRARRRELVLVEGVEVLS